MVFWVLRLWVCRGCDFGGLVGLDGYGLVMFVLAGLGGFGLRGWCCWACAEGDVLRGCLVVF